MTLKGANHSPALDVEGRNEVPDANFIATPWKTHTFETRKTMKFVSSQVQYSMPPETASSRVQHEVELATSPFKNTDTTSNMHLRNMANLLEK